VVVVVFLCIPGGGGVLDVCVDVLDGLRGTSSDGELVADGVCVTLSDGVPVGEQDAVSDGSDVEEGRVDPSNPTTISGTWLSRLVPSPSCPNSFNPQHNTPPSSVATQV
jgi:hypothetical protein